MRLSHYEQKRLEELWDNNYTGEVIICDVHLADKLKKRMGDDKRD